ncbi:MAG: cob(I)yrinic acid a,c-diamide adenosyltransferase [Deferribacteres bacterium]|nr:cob(I)yrinic acid a,c-diamide adenosyltransferase [candidate division KSB1 bacterium]MCB9503844.1 cob(I)yrinic acid a,c-diamide adenosyltransferase [Deferribacteres bacterium]
MPRLTKIYTKQGDDGTTSLGSRQRVPKDNRRVQAYGTVDELNSNIGLVLAFEVCDTLAVPLKEIQNTLFHLGSDLCFLEEDKKLYKIPGIEAKHVESLEKLIDELNETVGPLENFILPGGAKAAAQLHVARCVCRRAEREAITLSHEEKVSDYIISYLNRLSDALFVMARYENHAKGITEPLWDSYR